MMFQMSKSGMVRTRLQLLAASAAAAAAACFLSVIGD
uniref:Uncharacterized protein n=1 Tax=Rhizophora mucronata TaxID=61149 RepID=A0A2P2LW00_RHIMU